MTVTTLIDGGATEDRSRRGRVVVRKRRGLFVGIREDYGRGRWLTVELRWWSPQIRFCVMTEYSLRLRVFALGIQRLNRTLAERLTPAFKRAEVALRDFNRHYEGLTTLIDGGRA